MVYPEDAHRQVADIIGHIKVRSKRGPEDYVVIHSYPIAQLRNKPSGVLVHISRHSLSDIRKQGVVVVCPVERVYAIGIVAEE